MRPDLTKTPLSVMPDSMTNFLLSRGYRVLKSSIFSKPVDEEWSLWVNLDAHVDLWEIRAGVDSTRFARLNERLMADLDIPIDPLTKRQLAGVHPPIFIAPTGLLGELIGLTRTPLVTEGSFPDVFCTIVEPALLQSLGLEPAIQAVEKLSRYLDTSRNSKLLLLALLSDTKRYDAYVAELVGWSEQFGEAYHSLIVRATGHLRSIMLEQRAEP